LNGNQIHEPMLFISNKSSSENVTPASFPFSRKCATDEVPGVNRLFGER
jgi:hypothetical protein